LRFPFDNLHDATHELRRHEDLTGVELVDDAAELGATSGAELPHGCQRPGPGSIGNILRIYLYTEK
jgi:hypothetical protein